MMTDPIADLLIRMKNARVAKHRELTLPYSQLKEELVKLLLKNGYLGGYEAKSRQLVISRPYLTASKRLSKSGGRLYAGVKDLPKYLRGRRVTILSTSKGLMTAYEAFKKKLGGELICYVEK